MNKLLICLCFLSLFTALLGMVLMRAVPMIPTQERGGESAER
jgi:hypothetical protein